MSKRLPSLITVSEPACHRLHQSFLRLINSPLCVRSFFLTNSVFFLPLLSPIFLLPCNYSLSAVVKLAPPLPYLSGWAEQRVSWVRRQGGQKEQGEKKREKKVKRRPQMNGQVAERKQVLVMTSYPPSSSETASTIYFLSISTRARCQADNNNNDMID